MASRKLLLRSMVCALALGLAACSSGSSISTPGATNSGSAPGGGGGGGGGGTGGSAACPAGTTNAGGLGAFTVCSLSGEILNNLTLPNLANIVYRINGRVDVGRDLGVGGAAGTGVTVTIEPGVRLFGDVAGDIFVVNRGNRISAVGTVAQPIIFTSREDILGLNDPATASRQWGGVIVLGRAPIGGCQTAVAPGSNGCQNAVEGVTAATGRPALYGSDVPNDSSGVMRYVQIRYPGAFLSSAAAGDDLNGLTLGGVGSGTDFSFIQVHNSGDDGIEIFGGTNVLKNVVVTGAQDDSLDFDEGWTGGIQFAVVRQTALASGALEANGPDRLVESSNAPRASSGTLITTNPVIANFTFVGSPVNNVGAAIRGIELNNTNAVGGSQGSSGRYVNGVVTGSSVCAFTETSATNPLAVFNSNLFDCPTALGSNAAARIAAGTNNVTNVTNTLNGVLPGSAENARGATAFNASTFGSAFEATNYIGAFPSNATATSNWAAGWTFQLLPATNCPVGTTDPNQTVAGQRLCVLSGVIGTGGVPAAVRLTAGNVYRISGRVDVGVDVGADGAASGGVPATLTIDPGVTLAGATSGDMLIVNRGSQILANGTTAAPVVFTSLADLTPPSGRSDDTASREWGGVILLGRAPIKGCQTAVPAASVQCQNAVEGVTAATGRPALYGGATGNDTSGRLNNVQIRYPGAFLSSAAAGDDLNGLTLGGVGSGTTIQNVQVHNSGDDGIEIFGGTANLKNAIVTGAADDSLDFDEGYVGKMQRVLVLQNTVQFERDRIVESSNAVRSSQGGSLDTNPIIANFTFIGVPTNAAGSAIRGIELNNTNGASTAGTGSSGRYVNGVMTGSTTCLEAQASNTTVVPRFLSVLFSCPGANGSVATSLIAASPTNTTNVPATVNTSTALPGRFINGSAEAAATVTNPQTAFSATADTFFDNLNYIGAVRDASDTWWQGWSCGLQSGSSC